MSYIIDLAVKQAVETFNRMIAKDLNGQNWDCTIIPNLSNGKLAKNTVDPGVDTRFECYSKGGRDEKPQFRTMIDVPIHQGDAVYIPGQERYYLLEKEPQKDVDCYSTLATPCNGRVTVTHRTEDLTDDNGYLIEAGKDVDTIFDIPCVVTHHPGYSSTQSTPGTVIEDALIITLQRNPFAEWIQRGERVTIKGDSKAYTVTDIYMDGNPETGRGIIRLVCHAAAGEIQR